MNPLLLKAGIGATALALGGGFAVLSPASPAVAYSSPGLNLDISVSGPATLVAKGAAVRVPVTVTCSTGTEFTQVFLSVTEVVGRKTAAGSNSVAVGCTGSRENLVITVSSGNGNAFATGKAYVAADIQGCTRTQCGDENNSATIKVVK
jgi:hypothetical protein